MDERTPFDALQNAIDISDNPAGFRDIVEESAKKLGLQIFKIEFDKVVSETEDPDGTRHITIKPVLLEDVPNIDFDNSLLVLKGESLTYAVIEKSWGGMFTGGGDQTHYENIAVFRWETDLKDLRDYFQNRLGSILPSIYYHSRQNWVAGEDEDYIGSENLGLAISKMDEHDPLFEEILSRVHRAMSN